MMEFEESLKMFACDLIENSGIILKLPQTAMTTAQILLQRVYQTQGYTIDKYPLDVTAMACLFLAAKIEEYPKKAKEVMEVFTHVISMKLGRTIRLSSSEHEKVREELITAERRLLKNLGFNLLSSYPHKIIVNYYHAIVRKLDEDENHWQESDNQKILQRAWNYCNDSLRTDVFIRYSQVAVACACIHMACDDIQKTFPKASDGREWYHLFAEDNLEVEAAIRRIKNLYGRKRAHPHDFKRYMYLTSRI